ADHGEDRAGNLPPRLPDFVQPDQQDHRRPVAQKVPRVERAEVVGGQKQAVDDEEDPDDQLRAAELGLAIQCVFHAGEDTAGTARGLVSGGEWRWGGGERRLLCGVEDAQLLEVIAIETAVSREKAIGLRNGVGTDEEVRDDALALTT